MRPIYLEFCGVNSFSEPAKINFDELLEYGIFGIFGDTGSGKSTILDCIGFALFGAVSRSRTGSIADIINYRQDAAYVKFEFSIVCGGKRKTFRVERELKRKNASQTVHVYEAGENGYVAVADGCRESNAFLLDVIGLEQRDFEKCIALPQGEFAQFVKAQRGERLKLVSRLFDLEAYGEQLTRKVNRYCADAAKERAVAEAKLEPYADVSEEKNKALSEEIERLRKEEAGARAAFFAAQEEEKKLTILFGKREEAERNEAILRTLEAKREEMEELGREIDRLEKAARVLSIEREGAELRARHDRATEDLGRAKEKLTGAESVLSSLEGYDDEAAEREIEGLTELLTKAVSAEEIRISCSRAEKRLAEIAGELARERERFKGFDYDQERASLEEELDALGAGDPLEYVEKHGKGALFFEEYDKFAGELETLASRHREIQEDASPLIGSYRKEAERGRIARSTLGEDLEAARRASEDVRRRLQMLEQQKGRCDLHVRQVQQLGDEFTRLKGEIEGYRARLGDAPDRKAVEEKLLLCKRVRREQTEKISRAKETHAAAKTQLAAAEERVRGTSAALEDGRRRFRAALDEGGFQSLEEAKTLSAKHGDPLEAKRGLDGYRAQLSAALARKKEYEGIDFSAATKETLQAASDGCAQLETQLAAVTRRVALAEGDLERGVRSLEIKKQLEGELAAVKRKSELSEKLKSLLDGNKFMEYVAEEYLQTVAKNASGRLLSLTDGRYFLRYEGGFFVGDNLNGGKLRGVHTLSGGETFLVSLSLALALGAEICSRSLRPIEFFFLDEGFGTLDAHLVDTVMDSLEKLRGEHFSIGIISHVEELKHRIDRKLCVVKATEKQGSKITVE